MMHKKVCFLVIVMLLVPRTFATAELKQNEGRMARYARTILTILQNNKVKIVTGLGIATAATAYVAHRMSSREQKDVFNNVVAHRVVAPMEEKINFYGAGMLVIDASKLAESTKIYLVELMRKKILQKTKLGENTYHLNNSGAVLDDIANAKAKLGPQCTLAEELEGILQQLRKEKHEA